MQTSEQGVKMITAFEGIEEKAYKCPSGVWTIGVGHTGKVDGSPINAGMHNVFNPSSKFNISHFSFLTQYEIPLIFIYFTSAILCFKPLRFTQPWA